MQDIVFRGLKAPLRLIDAEAILPTLRDIAAGWDFQVVASDPAARPFYSITGKPGELLLWCECHLDDRPRRWFDPVNALCDAVSAMALALPAERPDLICLHAAAVAVDGRLLVFPNIRRAGKSTLSAALARAGHDVFSDDVLPVFFSEDGRAQGLAMGTALRLRLPLPQTVPAGFRTWVAAQAGPANAQYQYLKLSGQPVHGATLPIGAFVILDRQDAPVTARLSKVSPDAAMDALLHQNFTRDRHSADILQAIARTLADRPAYCLVYFDLDEAVACIEAEVSEWSDPTPTIDNGPGRPFRMADFDVVARTPFDPNGPFFQRPGSLSVTIGDKLYLADPEGRAIHRTDPLAAAVWALSEEPIRRDEIIDLMAEEFPEADRTRMAADLRDLIRHLHENGLIAG